MKHLKKYLFLIFPLLFLVFLGIFTLFNVENTFVKYGISGALAGFFSPRYRTHTTQSGEKTVIYWIFLKNQITI